MIMGNDPGHQQQQQQPPNDPALRSGSYVQVWMEWTPWTACSTTCGEGAKLRTRECPVVNSCEGPNYEYMSCHADPCATSQPIRGVREGTLLAVGFTILLNILMVCCILTPFLIRRMKTSKSGVANKSLPGTPTDDYDAMREEEPVYENIPETIPEPAPAPPTPPPRVRSDTPAGFPATGRGRGHRRPHLESQSSSDRSISSSAGFLSEGVERFPSFFVPLGEQKMVDLDMDKLFAYRPWALDDDEYDVYRPECNNDSRHCNSPRYRIERLPEAPPDVYRPSLAVQCERPCYRTTALTTCPRSVYRVAFLEEPPPKECYRACAFRPDGFVYRAQGSLPSDDFRGTKSYPPGRRFTGEDTSLDRLIRVHKSDVQNRRLAEAAAERRPIDDPQKTNSTTLGGRLKAMIRGSLEGRRKTPSTEPLVICSSAESREPLRFPETMERLKKGMQQEMSVRVSPKEDRAVEQAPKASDRKQVSFASSSQIKYIDSMATSSGSESTNSKRSTSSSESLFVSPPPPRPTSAFRAATTAEDSRDESHECTPLNSQANNSGARKSRPKQGYGSLVRSFLARNFNNSSNPPEGTTSSAEHGEEEPSTVSEGPIGVEEDECQNRDRSSHAASGTPRPSNLGPVPHPGERPPPEPPAHGNEPEERGTEIEKVSNHSWQLRESLRSLLSVRRKSLRSSSTSSSSSQGNYNSNNSLVDESPHAQSPARRRVTGASTEQQRKQK